MIIIKSEYDVQQIKKAAEIWKKVRTALIKNCRVGVSLNDLDGMARDIIAKNDATCSFYQYNGFSKHICISINDQIIHGIPNDYQIKENDLITFDVGVTYNNHVCDAAFTINMNPDNQDNENISKATYEALMNAIKIAKAGNYIGDISNEIERTANQYGYEVIRDYGGHGCGNKIHEAPLILNYGKQHTGTKLVNNMTLCIEPMLFTKNNKYYIDKKNNWTVIASNHKQTCHWEHMILIKDDTPEILTL